MEMARNTVVSSSLPKNYVTLRQLQELRLEEKKDVEERIPNPKQHRQAGSEARRKDEERPRNLNLEQREWKEAATANRKPFGSPLKLPSNGLRREAVRRAPPAPNSKADGGKGGGAGADPKPPIGEAAGGNPNAETKQKKSKMRKKKKRQAGDSNKKGDAVSAEETAEEVNGSEIIAAEPPPEESVQVKQVAGRNRPTKTAPNKSRGRRGKPSQAEEPNQLDEVKPVGGDGQRTVTIERPGIHEADSAAGRGNWSARGRRSRNGIAGGVGVGGRGGWSANRAGPVLVWVRKTASS